MKSPAQCVLLLFSLCYHLSSSHLILGGLARSPSDHLIPYMREVTKALRQEILHHFPNIIVPSYTIHEIPVVNVDISTGELIGLPNIVLNGHLAYDAAGVLKVLIVAEPGILNGVVPGILISHSGLVKPFVIRLEMHDTQIEVAADIDQVKCELSISKAYMIVGNLKMQISLDPDRLTEVIKEKYGAEVENVIYGILDPLKNLIGNALRSTPIPEPLRKVLNCIQDGPGAPT